jgi:hypothetical protein
LNIGHTEAGDLEGGGWCSLGDVETSSHLLGRGRGWSGNREGFSERRVRQTKTGFPWSLERILGKPGRGLRTRLQPCMGT